MQGVGEKPKLSTMAFDKSDAERWKVACRTYCTTKHVVCWQRWLFMCEKYALCVTVMANHLESSLWLAFSTQVSHIGQLPVLSGMAYLECCSQHPNMSPGSRESFFVSPFHKATVCGYKIRSSQVMLGTAS